MIVGTFQERCLDLSSYLCFLPGRHTESVDLQGPSEPPNCHTKIAFPQNSSAGEGIFSFLRSGSSVGTEPHYIALTGLESNYVDQAGLELVEVFLPLSPEGQLSILFLPPLSPW